MDWSLAENESTPQEVLYDIAENCSEGLAKSLLRNDKLEAQAIDVIVEKFKDERDVIKKAINHCNISAATLIKISIWYPDLAVDILATDKVKFVES